MKKKRPTQRKKKVFTSQSKGPRKGRWDWFICGIGIFFILSFFMYDTLTEIEGSDDYKHSQSKMLQLAVLILLFAIIAFNLLKNSVDAVIHKFQVSEKLTIDDIGHLFLVASSALSFICLVFFIDWSNWNHYITHISAITSVTLVRIIAAFFHLRKQKKENKKS